MTEKTPYYWTVFCRATQCHEAEGCEDTLEAAKAAAEAALTPDKIASTQRYTLEIEGPGGDDWELVYGEPEGWVKDCE